MRVLGFDPPTGWALLESLGTKWRWINGGSGITRPEYFILGIPMDWRIDLVAVEWVKKVVPRHGDATQQGLREAWGHAWSGTRPRSRRHRRASRRVAQSPLRTSDRRQRPHQDGDHGAGC